MNANRTILGIDVGLSGAIGMLDWRDPASFEVWPMPIELRSEKSEKKQVDVAALARLHAVIESAHHVDLIVIERPSAPPVFGGKGKARFGMGAFAALGIGDSLGCVRMFAALFHETQVRYVQPVVWKKALKLPREKEHAIKRAHKLFPKSKEVITLKKHDGLAEALLIAHYARLYL